MKPTRISFIAALCADTLPAHAGANANVTPGTVNTTPNVCGSIACP